MMVLLVDYLISLLAVLLVYLLWTSTRRPKNFPSGPRLFPIVGTLPLIDKACPARSLMKFRKKYGDIFSIRMGTRDIVYVCDFHIAKNIFNNPIFAARPSLFSFRLFKLGIETKKCLGVAFNNGAEWKEQRRFALRHLRDFGFGKTRIEDIILRSVQDMIKEFESKEGKPFNVAVTLNLAVLNIIWHMVANHRFDPSNAEDLKKVSIIDETAKSLGSFLPDLFPWTECLPDVITGVSWARKNSKAIFDLYEEEVKNHEQTFNPDEPCDLIDVYIKQIKEDQENGIKDSTFHTKQILGVISDMFAAGSETISTTLRFSFVYLVQNPDIQKQLQDDIRKVVGKDRMVSLNDRNNLPRVEAFTYEVMRCFAVAPAGLPHVTTETTTIDDYVIPKGTSVNLFIHDIHRNSKYWSDPDKFNPWRFLDDNGNLVSKKDGFLPFSIGKRICLGEVLAKAELFLFLAGLLQKFTFSFPSEAPPVNLDESEGVFVIHPPKYKIIATPYK